MRYYKRFWGEPRAGEYAGWGTATYLFEADGSRVSRQIELYEDGTVLLYDDEHSDDRYGGLADQPLDLADFAAYETTKDEFEAAWRPSAAKNRPKRQPGAR